MLVKRLQKKRGISFSWEYFERHAWIEIDDVNCDYQDFSKLIKTKWLLLIEPSLSTLVSSGYI